MRSGVEGERVRRGRGGLEAVVEDSGEWVSGEWSGREEEDGRSLDTQALDGLFTLEDLDLQLGVVLGENTVRSATRPARRDRTGEAGTHLLHLSNLGLELLVLGLVLQIICTSRRISWCARLEAPSEASYLPA